VTDVPGYVGVDALVEAADRVARGVVRILDAEGTPVSSGWLVTDLLVVVPAHVVSRGAAGRYRCAAGEPGAAPVVADVEFVAGRPQSLPRLETHPGRRRVGVREDAPALLRLRRPIEGLAPLQLAPGAEPGDPVFVVHFPEGADRPQISFGRVRGADHLGLVHDAATAAGSSGGPVVTMDGRVVSMANLLLPDGLSGGPSLGTLIGELRPARAWPEIRERHQLADVLPADPVSYHGPTRAAVPDDSLLAAAVHWSIDPEALSSADRDRLEPLVNDPEAARWTLRAKERQRLIGTASLDELRDARGPELIDDPRQRVMDRILAGPPYPLDAIEEGALPYWLQAVRWFGDAVPRLPGPHEVTRAIERRRLRSRLRTVAGPDFRGRGRELAALHEWYMDHGAGPLVVTGIGGIGKSALIARFANSLAEQTLLCWLDFDRPDLAPDDPDSIVAALAHQVSLQFPLPGEEEQWEARADELAAALSAAVDQGRPRPLLVLDGFEVAQHVTRHEDLWPVLERLIAGEPSLRIIVSGRAPVPDLHLDGRAARHLQLAGLEDAEATAWLRQRGVTAPELLASVLRTAKGIPLVLHLAVRFLDAGGDAGELPDHLPQAMIKGMLYNRILERVADPELIPLAREALVLRRLTVDVIRAVLGGSLPAGLDAGTAFDRLAREFGLIIGPQIDPVEIMTHGETEELRLRPDVRAPALQLLEREDPETVRAVDRRAADWYASLGTADPSSAAELVYHRLRLGDLTGAADVWQESHAHLLGEALDELPPAAQDWLRDVATAPMASQAAWEADAYQRIRAALARGYERAVPDILAERPRRLTNSRLTFYDAWRIWREGDTGRALAELGDFEDPGDAATRDRAVLAARILGPADPARADALLARVRPQSLWWEFGPAELLSLVVWAARVRLTVDLGTELRLLRLAEQREFPRLPDALRRYLHSSDVVLEALSRLTGTSVLASRLPVPVTADELPSFESKLFSHRQGAPDRVDSERMIERWVDQDSSWRSPPDAYLSTPELFQVPALFTRMALDLAVLGWRRKRLMVDDLSLVRACEESAGGVDTLTPFRTAVVGTLAAFRCEPIRYEELGSPDGMIERYLERTDLVIGENRVADYAGALGNDLTALRLYLDGPDPLDTLYRFVAGLPLTNE
jgi:hypothetical protein